MEQFTKQQAINFHDSGVWKTMSFEEIVKVQLFQDRLCMPFDKFHEAIEKVLGRSVWTHEFASQTNIVNEYLGIKRAPTFEEIVNLIPEDKRVFILTD